MNKTDRLALEIRQWIKEQPAYISYLRSRQAIDAHPELALMEKELKHLQQEIIQLKKDPEGQADHLIQTYEKKKAAFENHPLVVNYLADQTELNALFQYVISNIEATLKE